MGVFHRDIDAREEILIHEVPVALFIVGGQSLVFIQIDGFYLREIQMALCVPFNQLLVSACRSGACCQAQDTVRF